MALTSSYGDLCPRCGFTYRLVPFIRLGGKRQRLEAITFMARKKNAEAPGGDRKARLRKEFDSLHREMEIAEYATKGHGQYVRKVPRKESIVRTRKRKLLEKDDIADLAIHADPSASKRMRGSKIAFHKEVIEGSKVFGKTRRKRGADDDDEEDSDESFDPDNSEQSEESGEDDDGEVRGHKLEKVGKEGDEDLDEEKEEASDEEVDDEPARAPDDEEVSDDNEGDDEASETEHEEVMDEKVKTKRPRSKTVRKSNAGSSRNRRKLFKIRNFKSFRMAQRHGDALGAHARGLPKVAVEKLKQVARDAPAAPQVYSALGMVYEDMLQTSLKRSRSTVEGQLDEATEQGPDELIPDAALSEQVGLAKKAYGSYHVAAILCKKDFTLWVHAADCASEIANLHSSVLLLPNISNGLITHHRAEKKRWLSEARHDFIVADNLKPPGIDVPAKLASIEMELGNLSEALTILTDLKNRKTGKGGPSSSRSDFEKSYKAWLLYSDLMLRIGHECTQWNRGVQTNQNYMFRRWLRRFSHVFDWQERRLQGLIMGLEAAAGSHCCENLLKWAKQRVRRLSEPGGSAIDDKRWHVSSTETTTTAPAEIVAEKSKDESVGDFSLLEKNRDNTANIARPTTSVEATPAINFEDESELQREKTLLLDKSKNELDDFDKTTKEMNLKRGSQAAIERRQARVTLVQQQRSSLVNLESESKQQRQSLAKIAVDRHHVDNQPISYDKAQLPISGSISTVCSTASELIKHCLGMQLYEGGRLVGEVVTTYFKERAQLVDRRLQSRISFSQKQKSVDESVLLNFEPYDEINELADMSDDEGSQQVLLSDDEHLEEDPTSGLLDSLRRGLLPTEIRVLYSLCLIGEGGRDYVAAKCMESAWELEMETVKWLIEEPLDIGLNPDPLWNTFRRAMTELLTRTTAFSFANDVVRKTGKEERWCGRLAPLFRKHLDELRKIGLLDQLTKHEASPSPYVTMRKHQLLKVILGAARLDIANAELAGDKAGESGSCLQIIISTISTLTQLLESSWKVETNGSIARNNVEILELLARGFMLLLRTDIQDRVGDFLKDGTVLCSRIVSLFCGCSVMESSNEGAVSAKESPMQEWQSVPIPSTWQSDTHKAITLRVYNLCVSCNVSIFSGWEKEEFNLRLLRPWRGASNFFGVNVDNGSVSGYLLPSQEVDIAQQLEMLSQMLPWVASIDYKTQLTAVHESDWYKSIKEEITTKSQVHSVARHGEGAAINIMLCFSKACLISASNSDGAARESLIQKSLSVILPMCEFCLDQKLLQSEIGKVSTAVSSFDDWRKLADKSVESKEADSNDKPKQQSFPRRLRVERRVDEWLSGKKDRSTLTNVVKIPALEMLKEWKSARSVDDSSTNPREEAKEAMDKVHLATKQLRHCFTSNATEKASAQVAVALLELASDEQCQNPIICIQHAAMFASQGSKGGNNDERFRKALPVSEAECTPLEALMVLGRADCLHATYFPNEAAFLCSYVARVCRLHRDRLQPELEWTPQWKVIGILAYNLSVAIRYSMRSLFDTDAQRLALRLWDREVVEELERCRADAISWKKQLEGSNESTDGERVGADAFSDEEEEVADGEEASIGEGDEADDESIEVDQDDANEDGGMSDAGEASDASSRVHDGFEASPIGKNGALDNSYYADSDQELEEPEIVEV